MKSVVHTLIFSAFTLVACGGQSNGTSSPATVTDAGTSVTDVAVVVDSGTPTPVVDSGLTYPAGPYGSRVGATFRPFSLDSCNPAGTWHFDAPDFYSSRLTLVMISAGWCVPCQMETQQVRAQILDRYAGMGVRVVQILVQDDQHATINSNFCNRWVNRYGLSTDLPELMDPDMITSVYTPSQAFPGNIIVDRQGRIRWREYGTTTGLSSVTSAIDDVLSNPNP